MSQHKYTHIIKNIHTEALRDNASLSFFFTVFLNHFVTNEILRKTRQHCHPTGDRQCLFGQALDISYVPKLREGLWHQQK